MMDSLKRSKLMNQKQIHTFLFLVKTWRLHYPQCSSTVDSSAAGFSVKVVVANVASSC